MGVVITVMNMKGGVGKTTVAMHLAGICTRYRINQKARKVLAIDYDPQFNMSQAFLPSKTYFALEKARKTTLSILLDDDTHLNPYQLQVPGNHTPPKVSEVTTRIYNYTASHLDLIPSTLDLMYVALGQATAQTKPIEERFQKFIAQCRAAYDLVIVDCHPAGSLFTKTSLRNSDHVLIPVVPQRYAQRGIGLMMNFISAKAIGETAPKPHILFNSTPRIGVTPQETEIRATADAGLGNWCLYRSRRNCSPFFSLYGWRSIVGFIFESGKKELARRIARR
jgi:chromosome partitioning protein